MTSSNPPDRGSTALPSRLPQRVRPSLLDARHPESVDAGDLVRIALASDVRSLSASMAGVRLGDPSDVHNFRVGLLRLRLHLDGFAPLLEHQADPAALSTITEYRRTFRKLRRIDKAASTVANQAVDRSERRSQARVELLAQLDSMRRTAHRQAIGKLGDIDDLLDDWAASASSAKTVALDRPATAATSALAEHALAQIGKNIPKKDASASELRTLRRSVRQAAFMIDALLPNLHRSAVDTVRQLWRLDTAIDAVLVARSLPKVLETAAANVSGPAGFLAGQITAERLAMSQSTKWRSLAKRISSGDSTTDG